MNRKKEKSLGAINRLLVRRIIDACENEVLTLLQESIEQSGWYVRAKMFDTLVIEPLLVSLSLQDCLQRAEQYCVTNCGWDIKLIEKPLHGLQNEPLPTLIEARKLVDDFYTTNLHDGEAPTDTTTTTTIPIATMHNPEETPHL